MRLPILLAAGLMLAGASTTAAGAAPLAAPTEVQSKASDAISAAKRKKRPAGHRAYGRSGTQIACTRFGCRPIPPGCRIRTEYNPWTWNPTGFDAVVCPYR